MYAAILLILLGIGVYSIYRGGTKENKGLIAFGIVWILGSVGFFGFLGFWAEKLWFDALGYEDRFWTIVSASAGFAVAGAALGGLVVSALLLPLGARRTFSRWWGVAAGALLGGMWGAGNRDIILLFLNRTQAGISEPILGHDAGFYMFSLPFLDSLHNLGVLLALAGLGAVVLYSSFHYRSGQWEVEPSVFAEESGLSSRAFYMSAGILLLVLAFGDFLARFRLLFSESGVVKGPGWTDANITLHLLTASVIITGIVGIALFLPLFRRRLIALAKRFPLTAMGVHVNTLILIGVVIFGLRFVLISAVPKAVQWLRVEPNEITMEAPYIENNIKFTRHAYGLDTVEEREFPAAGKFTRDMVERNKNTFENIRLWDWRALDSVYKQFQEIRLYYEFVDVDIDRYTIDDEYREVMISAREMRLSNLPADSRTFVNRRFKYTHGYGVTMSDVSEFTEQGLPHMLIKDIPPVAEYDSLKIDKPQIYYGELTDTHVFVNTSEPEFDYPRGEKNVSIQYPGKGGVDISGLWRKFIFGWKFDGTKFFLSGYPRDGSKVMFHREIRDRVKTLAPFLHLDNDPYIVQDEGRLYWLMDAYTVSSYFPYAADFNLGKMLDLPPDRRGLYTPHALSYLENANYIKNSVKIVVDAFDGSVDFYVFEPDDPLIQAWAKVFPDMFKPREAMPERLEAHIRYPADYLQAQGLVYTKYHMTEPTVFYNQEDLWIQATEKYYNQVQPVQPYYIIWEPPDSDHPEFVVIQPYTPKNRQVLIGWIAGMCDGDNYGRLLAYKFPKEKRILGPQQVETKIDQDRHLSGRLTLWDQRGSQVIRGNVLAIPIEETLIYVEPIYLQAETAAYPELRLVAVMHNDNLSYAESFDEALEGLFSGEKPALETFSPATEAAAGYEELIGRASEAFNSYLDSLGAKDFRTSADALERLRQALNELTSRAESKEPSPQTPETSLPQ